MNNKYTAPKNCAMAIQIICDTQRGWLDNQSTIYHTNFCLLFKTLVLMFWEVKSFVWLQHVGGV